MHSGRRCSLQQNTARKQFAHSMFRVGGEDEEEVEQQKQSLMNDEFPSEGNPQDDSVAGTADHLAINTDTTSSITESSNKGLLRSRSNNVASEKKKLKRPCSGSRRSPSMTRTTTSSNSYTTRFWYCFCHNAPSCASMQCMATALLWLTVLSLLIATVWYSYELFNHGYVMAVDLIVLYYIFTCSTQCKHTLSHTFLLSN